MGHSTSPGRVRTHPSQQTAPEDAAEPDLLDRAAIALVQSEDAALADFNNSAARIIVAESNST